MGFGTGGLINLVAESTMTGFQLSGTLTTGPTTIAGNGTGLLGVSTQDANAPIDLITFSAPNATNGLNIKMTGNGAVTPSKTIRATNGQLQVVNNAYSLAILTLDDAGNLYVAGTVTSTTPQQNAGRNLVTNPCFAINQRGVASVSAAGSYPVDRWLHQDSQSGGSRTLSQVTLSVADRVAIGEESIATALRVQTTGGTASGDYDLLSHRMEGAALLAGKTATISFWAKAAAAGQAFGVTLNQYYGGGGGSGELTQNPQKVTLTTSWARYSVTLTVPSTAGKTYGVAGTDWTELRLWMSAGSAYNTGGVGVQNSDIQMTGYQIEVGTTTTSFERVNPVVELMKCQRHYQFFPQVLVSGYATGGNAIYNDLIYPVQMRAFPSLTATGNASQQNAGGIGNNGTFLNHIRLQSLVTATGNAFSIADVALAADL